MGPLKRNQNPIQHTIQSVYTSLLLVPARGQETSPALVGIPVVDVQPVICPRKILASDTGSLHAVGGVSLQCGPMLATRQITTSVCTSPQRRLLTAAQRDCVSRPRLRTLTFGVT